MPKLYKIGFKHNNSKPLMLRSWISSLALWKSFNRKYVKLSLIRIFIGFLSYLQLITLALQKPGVCQMMLDPIFIDEG